MSFDELPLGNDEAQPEVAVTSAEQSPSGSDAPPVARSRSKRVKATGTDAASKLDTSQEPTAKTSTSKRAPRKKAAATTAESAPQPMLPEVADEQPPADIVIDAPQTSGTRPKRTTTSSRKPRNKAAEIVEALPATTLVEQVVVPPPVVAESSAPVAKEPAKSRSTRKASPRKKPATPEPVAESTVTPVDQVTPANESSTATADQGTVDAGATSPSAGRSRRTSSRNRRKKSIDAEEVTSALDGDQGSPAIEESTGAAESEGADGDDDGDTVTISSDGTVTRKKRRRSRRSRRTTTADPATAPTAKIVTTAAEATVVEVVSPVVRVPEPEPIPYIDRTWGAHLIAKGGQPAIHINGYPYPPTLFFGSFEDDVSREQVLAQIRRASDSGVHLLSTLVELYCPLSEDAQILDKIDNQLRALLEADPDAYIMPRIVFVPARGWRREYPTDISQYADGTTGDPSITSMRFWQECERALHTLVTHIRAQVWGARVFGYHLERGEWFQPASLGYDRSIANRDAFRDWLRERYNHNLVALRSSWYDADVQFHTAEIPPVPGKPTVGRMFLETRKERRSIDFYEFTSESTAHRLCALAKAVKRASQYSVLVSVCYGYTTEFTHSYSGHLALNVILNDPHIDLLCGPPSYKDRKPGGGASIPALHDSIRSHGKLWLSEDDTKTWLAPSVQAPDDFNPRMTDRGQTEQAHMRAIGRALATGTAVGWMDLWGEGWLNDTGIWERIAKFASLAGTNMAEVPTTPRYDVIALVDEKSLLHLQPDEVLFSQLTLGMRDTLSRVGARIGVFLQSDLTSSEFPLDAKLYLFLNPFRLTPDQRNAVHEKLHSGSRTLVWVYGPGLCEDTPSSGTFDDAASGSVGIVLRRQPYDSEIGSKILETNHPVTRKMVGKDYGTKRRLNPSLFADDAASTVLAEYSQSGLPSMAVKEMHGWRSIFVGDPLLTTELLRGICTYAGVPLYTDQDDIVNIGGGWISLHASRDGHRTLRIPDAGGLYDLLENRMVINASDRQREHRFFMRTGTSRLFFTGSLGQIQSLGMPTAIPVVHQTELETDMLPAPELDFLEPEPNLPEPEPYLPAPPNADLETLRAVLTMDIPALDDDEFMDSFIDDDDDLPLSPATEEQRAASALTLEELLRAGENPESRRRRRRGGRGRGRRTDLDDGGLPPPPGSA